MIINAKSANKLSKEFDWKKFILDTAMSGIWNTAKSGHFSYTLYVQREVTDDILIQVIQELKNAGYTVGKSQAIRGSRDQTVTWN